MPPCTAPSIIIGAAAHVGRGPCSRARGGKYNIAAGTCGTVGGGNSDPTLGNKAYGALSAILGGSNNITGASGDASQGLNAHIAGGESNVATGTLAGVTGGDHNQAPAWNSTVSGGSGRTAPNPHNWVGGVYISGN